MRTPTSTFRLDPKTLKTMDKLLTKRPSVIVDGDNGAARNRTELIAVLVKKAAETLAEPTKKDE